MTDFRTPRVLLPVAAIATFTLLATAVRAQQVDPLDLGLTREAELDSAGAHRYAVVLPADHFVLGEVVQHTVDAVVDVFRPDGSRVARYDASARGPEMFSFTSDTSGVHQIEVTPFEEQSGRYAITLRRLEPVATAPEGTVDQLMAAFDGDERPGGVVALFEGGEVAFAKAYGMADLTHGVPNTTETLFNIGSVSKQFAGIFFAMMAEEGRLSLDDDVRTYVPEFPDFDHTVTLRHVLNHTSGFREAYGVLGLQGRSVDGDVLRRQDALDAVIRQPALQFPPGSLHLYNSTAYVILTEIAERISGVPYPDWMAEHVFRPLGMTSTRIEREPGEVLPGSAFSYASTETGAYREDFEAYNYYGATDVYTNVHDLAHWIRNFRTSELGGPGVMRRMTERSLLADGDTLRYTLGLVLDRHLGLDRIQHGGSTGGYRAFLAYYPELDAGVAVMANTGGVSVGRIATEAFRAFFADRLPTASEPEQAPTAAAVDTLLLDEYAGRYWIEGAGGFTMRREGDGLVAENMGGRPMALTAQDDSTFRANGYMTFLFHREPDGTVERAALRLSREGERPMVRIPQRPSDQSDLEDYAGRYFSEEIETFYTLTVDDTVLTLEHRRLGAMPLERWAPDLFLGRYPVREVIFERDATGGITGFRVIEGRTMGVRFRRVAWPLD